MYLPTKGTLKKISEGWSNDAYAMFVCVCIFSTDFLYKSIYCWYSFELHRQVDAIQMGTHNICFVGTHLNCIDKLKK